MNPGESINWRIKNRNKDAENPERSGRMELKLEREEKRSREEDIFSLTV